MNTQGYCKCLSDFESINRLLIRQQQIRQVPIDGLDDQPVRFKWDGSVDLKSRSFCSIAYPELQRQIDSARRGGDDSGSGVTGSTPGKIPVVQQIVDPGFQSEGTKCV